MREIVPALHREAAVQASRLLPKGHPVRVASERTEAKFQERSSGCSVGACRPHSAPVPRRALGQRPKSIRTGPAGAISLAAMTQSVEPISQKSDQPNAHQLTETNQPDAGHLKESLSTAPMQD